MPETRLEVDVAWRAGAAPDAAVRRRVAEELRAIAWELTQLQALVHDAHQATGLRHAYLVPRMELRLPLFDLGLRYRVVLQQLDRPRVVLQSEAGRTLAEVRFV